MSICINCGRLMPKDSKYCPECGAEANSDFSCVYECIKGNVGITPIHSIMAYCELSRKQTAFLLRKFRSMGYVAGNDRDGYWLTPVGAKICRGEKELSIEEDIENEIRQVFEYLSEHKDTSLSQISQELNIPIPKVRDVLKKLRKRGKITLL